jgi:hypothetical protein
MGVGGQRHAPATLPPGITRYPLYPRAGHKISPPPGFDPRTVQLVASRYTDYAIPAHCSNAYIQKNVEHEERVWRVYKFKANWASGVWWEAMLSAFHDFTIALYHVSRKSVSLFLSYSGTV